ncbi:MAG: riboflavin synthase subunit alpha [Spirochaetes bacterium GWF1_51_8]|nr:MAG: riboflavin synthase subunit alpha [Spirochaetes bacterium GWF1_51_8]
MFTGIIRHTGKVVSVNPSGEGKRITVSAPPEFLARLEKGITSIAIDGACHTAETFDTKAFTVYSSFETLARTTIGGLTAGSEVNLELPLTPHSLMDGHIVQGHVDGIGRIEDIEAKGESRCYTFSLPKETAFYLVEKDSISIDGISLTLFNIAGNTFQAAVIPETIANTSLSRKKPGANVNIEVNILAKYAARMNGASPDTAMENKLKNWLAGG